MPLLRVAILAALQGFTEALPLSRSGHGVVARIWIDGDTDLLAFESLLHFATALALVAVARRRLASAVRDGLRAILRRGSFTTSPAAHDARLVLVGSVVSLAAGAIVGPRVEMWRDSPAATGFGLCVTGLALASTAQIPRMAAPTKPASSLSLGAAFAVGLAHGLAAFPGASRVGVALTVLLWLGVRPGRATDLALLVTVPSLLVAGLGAFFDPPTGGALHVVGGASLVLAMLICFVSAGVGSEMLRSLADRRRVALLALWIVPLGLAILAYARALPS